MITVKQTFQIEAEPYSNISVKAFFIINSDGTKKLWSEMSLDETIKFLKTVKKYEKQRKND